MSASSFTPQGSQTAAPSVVTPRSGHVTGHVTGGGMVVSGSTDDFSRFSAIPRKIPRSESTPVFSPQKMQGMFIKLSNSLNDMNLLQMAVPSNIVVFMYFE